MNKAIKELRSGIKWANADLDPQWYGMGAGAMEAMTVYPPMKEWEAEHPGDDVHWNSKALELAATPEFESFVEKMFPEEDEADKGVPPLRIEDILAPMLPPGAEVEGGRCFPVSDMETHAMSVDIAVYYKVGGKEETLLCHLAKGTTP